MIPILYESTETAFANNGLGRLADCIECEVTEERNGRFECEFVYPMTGAKFSEITEGRIIAVSHDETGDVQPFDIYAHSAPIDGKVTFYAHHISYRQAGIVVKPFTATTCAGALNGLLTNSIPSNPFNYSTDKNVTANYTLTVPKPLNTLLKSDQDSILSVYGTGEYKFDKFHVYLYASRGSYNNVAIRYGKNLVDLKDDVDFSDTFNGIVPFWVGSDDTVVTLSEYVLYKSGSTYDGRNTVIPVDFSGSFEDKPTQSQLRAKANSYLASVNSILPDDTLTVNFVELWKTDEYKQFASLQTVNLCDEVDVIYDQLNINVRMKVIKTVWNVLLDRYNEIQLGSAPATYAEVITAKLADQAELARQRSVWAQAWASDALSIAENTDQYFWFTDTGTDTGAHITEVPRETFITDPSNGGGNLLARSNGIAVRNGLVELATFGASGSQVGLSSDGHTIVDANGLRVYKAGTVIANIGYGPGAAISGTADAPYYTLGTRKSNSVVGNYSFTAGYDNEATKMYSVALGTGSSATGNYAVAIGREAKATGYESLAFGTGANAKSNYDIAIGKSAESNGGIALGEGTKAGANQYVIGAMNVDESSNVQHKFIIGNGASARSDLFMIEPAGDLVILADSNSSDDVNLRTAVPSALKTVGTQRFFKLKTMLADIYSKISGKGTLIGRNYICYANSRVDYFTDGQITVANSSLGVTTGSKPVGILLTPSSSTVVMRYHYDGSDATNSNIRAYNLDGTGFNGNLRYFAVVFQNTWTST